MAENDIQRYLDGIESQHSGKPRFMAHLTAILEKLDGGTGAGVDMAGKFNIDTATGGQLDIIGRLVGISRYDGMDDDQYRILLYAKVFANHWDGTIETFHEIWEVTLGRVMDASYVDNQDMTVDIHVNGFVSEMLLNLIPAGKIIPKPMGVRYKVTNHLPEIIGQNNLYSGVGLYSVSMHTMGTVELPDFDDVSICADGLGSLLLDGFGVILGL